MIFLPLLLSLPSEVRAPAPAEKVVLRTEDKFVITGEFHAPRGLAKGARAPAVLLVHDAGGSRADLEGIAELLAAAKVGALRLDLRGHGDSQTVEGGKEPYEWKKSELRGDKPFLKMRRELEAAVEWLRGRSEVDAERLGIVGLGSGGSLGLRVGMSEDAFRVVVVVAPPGLADRGFDLTLDLKRVDGRAVLLVADARGETVARDLQKIAAQASDSKPVEVRVTKESGSAASLLKAEKGLDRSIATWVKERFAGGKRP